MKKIFIIFIALFLFIPLVSFAQEKDNKKNDEVFKASVQQILEEKDGVREDGSKSIQQKIKLRGLEGSWKNKEIVFDGTEIDLLSASRYKQGDLVLINYSPGPEGEDNFYIVGYSRSSSIFWLTLLFVLVVIVVGRLKGFRSLFVLLLTFLIILQFIIPKILAGGNPLVISIFGSFIILVLSVYITEGFKKTSTIVIAAMIISLIITGLISYWFTGLTKLTGFASEESMFLMGLAGGNLNVQGLLLAGIIIGSLGVLDDIVISQVIVVEEFKHSNENLTNMQVYSKAMKVGISHLSSMVNTLFLAYAGASLPLLILFSVKQAPFYTFSQVIDNEMIATEIVRTLAGSIGLVLAIPIATLLAVKFIDKKTLAK